MRKKDLLGKGIWFARTLGNCEASISGCEEVWRNKTATREELSSALLHYLGNKDKTKTWQLDFEEYQKIGRSIDRVKVRTEFINLAEDPAKN